MGFFELFILSIGLSMDAFAVSICKGLSLGKCDRNDEITVGLWFGGFQAFMPFLGYILGVRFKAYITQIDHWIAFILLGTIGINMIKEAFGENEELDNSLSYKKMFPLALATSIDALAVGITFAFLNIKIIPAISLIGLITFVLSAIGVKLGCKFGVKYKKKAEILGGVILVFLGIKILLEHLNIL